MKASRFVQLLLLLVIAGASAAVAASLADPAVDAYNLRIGTQAFGALYQFTTNMLLLEEAQAIQGMGSDTIKFYLGHNYLNNYPGATAGATSLTTLARDEPHYHQLLDMPFRRYFAWTYTFASTADYWWKNGFSQSTASKEYNDIYNLTQYLLTNYNNSGKTFYLGHWEGDWSLLPDFTGTNNPTSTAVQGMIGWLNTRQKAIDDAKANTTHSNVNVFLYVEVNRVRDAMFNGFGSNQRVVNYVLPYVTNVDYVSWSSYDGQNLSQTDLYTTLNYIESHTPTAKAGVISGKRVFVGEYGWGGISTDAQEPLNRAYMQKLINWGCPFVLYWQLYNNESGQNYDLINAGNMKVASYYLHQRFYNNNRLLVAQFKQSNGRLPTDAEFQSLVSPTLNQAFPAPVSLTVANVSFTNTGTGTATATGTLTQGVYGEECAKVYVYWGTQDGGATRGNWQNATLVGTNSSFSTASFTANFKGLSSGPEYYCRFYATNNSGEAWASTSMPLTNPLSPAPPTGLTAIVSNGVILLSWNASTGATNYNVKRSTDGGPYEPLASPAGTNYTDGNVISSPVYYYVVSATNGVGEGPNSAPVSVSLLAPADFAYRMKITFTGYSRAETLSNFPALVKLDTSRPGFAYRQMRSANGSDLRFTDAGGCQIIPHEIDEWNTNGTSWLWVQVPQLTGTNASIWAYWGNPASSNPPAWTTNEAVWSANYQLVWHLKESGFPFADSAQQYPALSGVAPVSAAGVVGRGCSFDGSSQFLDAGTISVSNAFTLFAWVNVNLGINDIQTVWANKSSGSSSDGFALYVNSWQTGDQKLVLETGNGTANANANTGAGAVTFGQWHQVAAVVNRAGGTARLFVDGMDQTTGGNIRNDFSTPATVDLGRFASGYYYYFNGDMDEVRIESGVCSSNWVWASWMTVASNATFATYSVVNPQPTLAVSPTESGVRLSWPAGLGTFNLVSTTDLTGTNAWLPVATPPAFSNGLYSVEVPVSGSAEFFKLKSP